MRARKAITLLFVACVASPAPAGAAEPWPPLDGRGLLFVHFGEEHLDDHDGERIFPRVIEESIRFGPRAVFASADKSSDGTTENLERWKVLMQPYQRAGIPYYAGVGNHDRKAPPGVPGGLSPVADGSNYQRVFADRPYPFGDATPVADPSFSPRERPAGDPPGASTHYSVDVGNVRWIVLDNSCYGLTNCDGLQNPGFPEADGSTGQFDFLARRAAEAKAGGKRVFVMMHMPTQDPRPGHSQPTPSAHTMGEGTSPDNARFEDAAAAARVDGVFVAHVKGQWVYTAQGVPYYTDGGAGGELYVGSSEQVGVDSGYWHGFRLVRVLPDGGVTTDTVPVLVPGSIDVGGPDTVAPGEQAAWKATAKQPTVDGPKVDALELRDPDRGRPNGANLPVPARIWDTTSRLVLAPVAGDGDDPRRDPLRETTSGQFAARCPGRARVTIRSGFESHAKPVTVPSRPGALARRFQRGPRVIRAGRRASLGAVELAQPARVVMRVKRRGKTLRTLVHTCAGATGETTATWDGRVRRGRRLVRVGRGTYTVDVHVVSDRRPIVRHWHVRVR